MQDQDDKKKSQSIGGRARAAALTPEKRREIARRGAVARWGEKPLRATHKGNFKEEFGFDVECYVIDDESKTAVISQRGMGAALGLGDQGKDLPRFLRGQRIAPYVGAELAQKLDNPLIFQVPQAGGNALPVTAYGYDVTLLIDVCKVITRAHADGKLLKRQEHILQQAQVIANASSKLGIRSLVYALAGYDATRAEVVAAFKVYVREEAREYEKEFPDMLYEEWYRLYQLPKPERNKPWKFKALTLDHVYRPLARSSGKILELTKARKAESEDRRARLHQFLSEVGVKALRMHLGQLLGIAQVSESRADYERYVTRVFGTQLELDGV